VTRSKTHTAIRFTAAAALAFYALATGRALIPGLCETLAAVQEDAVHAQSNGAVCCPSDRSASDAPVVHASGEHHADCAFCALSEALCVPPTTVNFEPVDTFVATAPADYLDPHVAHDDAPAISRRGPPALA